MPKETERWQCRTCMTSTIQDRLLGVVADGTEIHRLTCKGCGAVSYYDRKPGKKKPIMHSEESFLWVPGAGDTA